MPEDPGLIQCIEIQCFPKGNPWLPSVTCKSCEIDRSGQRTPVPREAVLHDTSTIRIRHKRLFNLPTFLVMDRRRFKCEYCGETFSEHFDGIHTRTRVTDDLRKDIIMTAIKRPFSDAAALMSVDDMYVKRTFRTYAATRLKDYRFKLPTIMGVDEVYLFSSKRANFVVTDLYNKRILDFGDGRTFEDIGRVFSRHNNIKDRTKVKVFVQDMNEDYKEFARKNFPEARIIIDKFHVLMKINDSMNAARIAFGKGPGVTDEDRRRLGRLRFLFLGTSEKLTEAEANLRDEILQGSPVLSAAYEIKRRFYGVYQQKTRAGAEERYSEWVEKVRRENAVHFMPTIETINNWRNEIFNYFDFRNRYNNGFVEALNGRLRRIHEAGPLLDFETFRAKALLRYGTFIGDDKFWSYSTSGMPQDDRRRAEDEGPNVSSGFAPDAFFSDLEQGLF